MLEDKNLMLKTEDEIVDSEIVIKRCFDSATTEDQQDIQVTQSSETDNIEPSCSSEPVVRRCSSKKTSKLLWDSYFLLRVEECNNYIMMS